MKRVLLMAFMIGSSLGTVACDKDKPTQQEMIRACMWDATGQCQKQAAAYAGAPGVLPVVPPTLNSAVPTTPVVVAPPGTPGAPAPVLPPGGVKLASVDAVKAHQQQVAAAIKADSMNPNSLRYDPPQASRGPASVQPASATGSVPDLPSFPSNYTSDGDATR